VEELSISVYILAGLFFVVALAYSSVGLGGGSSYTALMAIFGVNFLAIPTITLTLNLFVTSIGSFNFIRKKHARLRLILPFFISSIPMSYIGGSLKLPKDIFYWILLITLIFVALRIYVWEKTSLKLKIGYIQQIILSLIAGSVLGLIAGIVGIGGGIYLIPLIIILGLGTEKEAAACGSIFIWVNSLSGLMARIQHNPVNIAEFIPLIIAVVLGGTFGSYMGSSKFAPKTMQKVLGGIIIIAIIFLAKKILSA
jgi:uncharacterized membrane protein YfcA